MTDADIKDQRTKHEIGLCGYCMKQMAHQMAMVKRGTNARYRRWMCDPCIQYRSDKGIHLILSTRGAA
jgi:hypothetical protein